MPEPKQKSFCRDHERLETAVFVDIDTAVRSIPDPLDGGISLDDPPDVGGSYPGGSLSGMLIDTGVYLYQTRPGHDDLAEWQASAVTPTGDYSILKPVGRAFVLHISSERAAEREMQENHEYSEDAQALWVDSAAGSFGDTEVSLGWAANATAGADMEYKLGQAFAWMAAAKAAADESGADNEPTRTAIANAIAELERLQSAFSETMKKWKFSAGRNR